LIRQSLRVNISRRHLILFSVLCISFAACSPARLLSTDAATVEEISRRTEKEPAILFVGRFDPRNGLGTMLEAFEQVWSVIVLRFGTIRRSGIRNTAIL